MVFYLIDCGLQKKHDISGQSSSALVDEPQSDTCIQDCPDMSRFPLGVNTTGRSRGFW
ncbi:MAG: hypothetical protein QNJ70_27525 [Xenococcaceae cyanobacterium MO_207.B15]|nr:hypothetical protein [Xenococcaceae cyanobacterium MO_207.B15]MDJ0747624.1 hypothetical protein [Xenococcaceae cyanobacterium MO_167.B27]